MEDPKKAARIAALQKLMDVLDEAEVASVKPKAVSVSVEKMAPEPMAEEMPAEMAGEAMGEPSLSPEELELLKAKLDELAG